MRTFNSALISGLSVMNCPSPIQKALIFPVSTPDMHPVNVSQNASLALGCWNSGGKSPEASQNGFIAGRVAESTLELLVDNGKCFQVRHVAFQRHSTNGNENYKSLLVNFRVRLRSS